MFTREVLTSVSMTVAQRLALLETALSQRDPKKYFNCVALTFGYLGRDADARLAFQMARLVGADAHDTLAEWHAEWAAHPMRGG